MSRVGLFLSALYAAVIVICLAFAYDAGSDFKGQYVFLQLPIALQSSLLQWLDHTSSIGHLSWAAAYLLFGLPTFALLYLVGWLIDRCRSNLSFKRDVELGLSQLPKDLLIPIDDGAAAHLTGLLLPHLELPSTDGFSINLAGLRGRWVIYIYPMTGAPGCAVAGWLGWHSRCAGVHPAVVRFSGSLQRVGVLEDQRVWLKRPAFRLPV
jgi:hypothetical protein